MIAPAEITHHENEAGFTLVELLVGLAVFTLLITVLLKNIQFGFKAWSNTSTNIEQTDRAIIVQDVLRRLIGNLYPMTISESGGQPLIDLDGSQHALTFLGSAPLVARGAGQFRYKLWVEEHNSRKNLILTSVPELEVSEDQSMTAKTVLLSDIVDVKFSYLGEARAQQIGGWAESWARRSDIPRLVRISVTFRDGERAWPELLIAPRVLADVGCVYDSLTMRCRGR